MNGQIAAVVVTYNRLELLKELISALREQTRKPDTVIVVNNSSTDGTLDWLSRQNDLSVITQENLGSSGGQYTGIKAAFDRGYEWIWIMDDDVEPAHDCLEKLLNHKAVNNIPAPLRYFGGVVYLNDAISYNLKNPFHSFWEEIINESHIKQKTIPAVGITFEGPLFHRSLVDKIGLPLRDFFIYGDDTEFFLRASKAGYMSFIVTDAHLHRKLETADAYKQFTWRHYYIIRNIIAINVIHCNKAVRVIRPFGFLIRWLFRSKSLKDIKVVLKGFIDGYFYKREL